MEQLSPLQLEALNFLRTKFGQRPKVDDGFEFNDQLYLRYLRARHFDKSKAAEMIQHSIDWRIQFGVPDMDSWADIMKIENVPGKTYVRGFDKEGHVIMIMRAGRENTQDYDGNLKHLVYNMEKAVRSMVRNNNGAEKILLLIDFTEYTMFNASPVKTAIASLNILQNQYPERLYRVYCINPPWSFSLVYDIVYPLIDPVTRKKIVMVSGKDKIKAELLRIADAYMLETDYGGNDSRPFNSSLYLTSPMDYDFYTILCKKEESEKNESSIDESKMEYK